MASRLLNSKGFIEVRTYTLHPARFNDYVQLCTEAAALRKRLNPGFLAFFTPEAGTSLNQVTHLYGYASYDDRDATRARMAADPEWRDFVAKGRPCVAHQENRMLVEALECARAAGAKAEDGSAAGFVPVNDSDFPVYEWREYQLELGYNPIPKLRELFVAGLPSKVAADEARRGEVALMAFTDVGPLNRFVEAWRFRSMEECLRAREASRTSAKWRETIAGVAPMVQSFSTCFLRPSGFSPWK